MPPTTPAQTPADTLSSRFVAALKDQAVYRLTLDGSRITGAERIPVGKRVRDLRLGPDGWLYLLTDSPTGRVLRVEPVEP